MSTRQAWAQLRRGLAYAVMGFTIMATLALGTWLAGPIGFLIAGGFLLLVLL